MAEATTGNNLAGVNQSTGIISRITTSISNVRRMTSDPAVQKSIPLIFGVIVAFVGLIVFFYYAKIRYDNPLCFTSRKREGFGCSNIETKWS